MEYPSYAQINELADLTLSHASQGSTEPADHSLTQWYEKLRGQSAPLSELSDLALTHKSA